MAENDQTQEKTQEPTQRRLEKAREDGDVLSSKETYSPVLMFTPLIYEGGGTFHNLPDSSGIT